MSYLRKNYLTINEDPEIWEVVSDDGRTVEFFGTHEECIGVLEEDCYSGDDAPWPWGEDI